LPNDMEFSGPCRSRAFPGGHRHGSATDRPEGHRHGSAATTGYTAALGAEQSVLLAAVDRSPPAEMRPRVQNRIGDIVKDYQGNRHRTYDRLGVGRRATNYYALR